MYKKILLATDGSKHINRAAATIIGFYKKWSSEIAIFHSVKHMLKKVSPPSHGWSIPYASDVYFNRSTPTSPLLIKGTKYPKVERISRADVLQLGERILNEKKAIFEEVQIPVKIHLITKEYPEEYIERMVKKEKFDLVVVGIKGIHSKISQIFLGSVAESVVKNAPSDVLIIR